MKFKSNYLIQVNSFNLSQFMSIHVIYVIYVILCHVSLTGPEI
jgi:hypothetical protein